MGLDARNQLGLTETETLDMMASGKGYEENQQGRDAVQSKLDRLSGPASPDEPNIEYAQKGRWIGPDKPPGGNSGWISEDMRQAVERHHAKLDNSQNPIDIVNKNVDALSEQERFVRFGTTDRKVIVDNLMNLNKKVDKYVEARSMLDSMSEGQLQNRFASTNKQDILGRLGYDKNFLREINQYNSGGANSDQRPQSAAAEAASIGMQSLISQMNNSNFAKDAANIIKENPVLQKAVLGEVVYRPGEQQQGVGKGGGKQSKQQEALQIIQQLKKQHKPTRPGITDPVGERLDAAQNQILGAIMDEATYTDRQKDLTKDEMANRAVERKLKLLKLLGSN